MEKITYPNYYRLLCLDLKATKDQIKKAYRGLQGIYHPDKNPDKIEWATEMSQKINKAYETLSNPEKKRAYDEALYKAELLKNKKEEEQKRKNEEELRKREWKGPIRPPLKNNSHSPKINLDSQHSPQKMFIDTLESLITLLTQR